MNSNASLNKAQEEGRKFWLTSCCHVLCSKHDRELPNTVLDSELNEQMRKEDVPRAARLELMSISSIKR